MMFHDCPIFPRHVYPLIYQSVVEIAPNRALILDFLRIIYYQLSKDLHREWDKEEANVKIRNILVFYISTAT